MVRISCKFEYVGVCSFVRMFLIFCDKHDLCISKCQPKQNQRSTAPTWYQLFSFSQLVSDSDFQLVIISFFSFIFSDLSNQIKSAEVIQFQSIH